MPWVRPGSWGSAICSSLARPPEADESERIVDGPPLARRSARMVLRESAGELAQHDASWMDVRDWSVRTLVDNALAGMVHELLLDERNIPRYLDVALTNPARHVLVPIGQARADRVHHQIWLPGFAHDQF